MIVRLAGRAAAPAQLTRHRQTVEIPWAGSLREYRSVAANLRLYWYYALTPAGIVLASGDSRPLEMERAAWRRLPVSLASYMAARFSAGLPRSWRHCRPAYVVSGSFTASESRRPALLAMSSQVIEATW